MLEIAVFVMALVYAATLPGRIAKLKAGEVPAKFAADPAAYTKRMRNEARIFSILALIWGVKDVVEVLFLRDVSGLGGVQIIVWLLIAGWFALAVALHVLRRPLDE
ncbi:MAG: hypothetical protein IPK81_24625 [Rhodospirillales bacterium]|nr:MAG: hypothetical protein IPK81_24625 [Rhodospirillales bacterium]